MASAFIEFREWIETNYEPQAPNKVVLGGWDLSLCSIIRYEDRVYGPVSHEDIPERFRGLLVARKKVA